MESEPFDATVRGIGVRAPWHTLPGSVIAALEDALAAPITGAVDRAGGFSPGPAAVLRLGDGREVFAKAADGNVDSGGARTHEREARIAAWLPGEVPSPRLLGTVTAAGWVVVLFEAFAGSMPDLPWRADDLQRLLEIADAVARVEPSDEAPLPVASKVAGALFGCWAEAEAHPPTGLDAWSAAHLDVLRSWAEGASAACAGRSLVHGDLRADNMLVAADRAVLVDWPHASVGAPWLDLAVAAPSIAMQGGPPPEELVATSQLLASADPDALTAVVVGTAGYFTVRALEPPPVGLPTVRRFQAAQGVVTRRWAAQRLGLRPPEG